MQFAIGLRMFRVSPRATINQIKIMNSTTYRIKADYGYFSNTLRAPKNGYVMGLPTYDSFTGREFQSPLEFEAIEDAHNYITAKGDGYYEDPEGLGCEYDGKGSYSVGGQYVCNHGQHSRPVYTIVSAKSGRCNKEIIAACDNLAAAIA